MACNILHDMTETTQTKITKKSRYGKLAVEQTIVKVNHRGTSVTSFKHGSKSFRCH